jgi:hypothetical protein
LEFEAFASDCHVPLSGTRECCQRCTQIHTRTEARTDDAASKQSLLLIRYFSSLSSLSLVDRKERTAIPYSSLSS